MTEHETFLEAAAAARELWTLNDGDVRIAHGDAIERLRQMPAGIAQTCITSPPFWGLRDYGCDGQIGLEQTPDEWVARLVDVFREVRRVLRDDGTLWLEVGDSYAGGAGGRDWDPNLARGHRSNTSAQGRLAPKTSGLKPKDLCGAPWLLAFALRADGWYLRSDIIWARPNPMPESVTDRPTKAHSYVFLLTKRARYYWDADAIREAHVEPHGRTAVVLSDPDRYRDRDYKEDATGNGRSSRMQGPATNPAGRNARSVWQIATEPTPFAHFATFPQELVRRCILAGTSERGGCPACGAPWARQTEVDYEKADGGGYGGRTMDAAVGEPRSGPMGATALNKVVTTTGWVPTCSCPAAEPVPQVCLDPFMGSGTTALVARHHGRHAIGCELNADYLDICRRRLQQLSLLGDTA